jgi:hypothetical protein
MPVIRRQRSGSQFEASLSKQFEKPYLRKIHHKKGLVEGLKV